MTSKTLECFSLIVLFAWLPNLEAQTGSIADSASSSPEVRHTLITEYESSTNGFQDERLLAVAISYAVENKFEQAKPAYDLFLRVHPESIRALRGLGICYFYQGHYNEAINFLKKAWSWGDHDSLASLTASYLGVREYDQVEALVPNLLKQSQGDGDIVKCLMIYSLSKNPLDIELFLKAMEGLPDNKFVIRDDIAELVSDAITRLKAMDLKNTALQAILQKIIRGYVANADSWPKARLPGVAGAYLLLGDYSKSEIIYKRVLATDPKNREALQGLGAASASLHKFREAITNYRAAWSLGEQKILPDLAASYIAADDLEGMRDLIPVLLERKLEGDNLKWLIAYTINKKDKEFFFKAIEGITDMEMLQRGDTVNAIIVGFKLFGDDERAKHLLELKAKQDKGVGA